MRSNAEVTRDWVRAIERSRALQAEGSFAAMLARVAAERGAAPALLGENEAFSHAALLDRVAHWAAWAETNGVAPGACVALLMPNRPEYVAIWAGLSHAGVTVALLNTHLSADGLAHCIRAAGARTVIVDERLQGALPSTTGGELGIHVVPSMAAAGESRIAPVLQLSPGGLALESRPALYIYTSGTTGLPKATRISHARVLDWSGWFAGLMDAGPDDRLFDCLPLYHSTGGVVAIGAMLASGGSVVIRERFSSSRFWAEIVETGCTIFQYIGELCRYLLNGADAPAHGLRLACGNGLSGAVWPAFQERFRIPRILEFYAATEGGVSLYNCEGLPGAVGRIPPVLRHRFPLALIETDEDGEPMRDAAGRCAGAAEGELIARVSETVRFEGYTDAAASARKLLADVFEPGDRWFRTGDRMRRDERGFFFFVDRLGDTFRWKGENVAAAEVAAVLLRCPGVADAAVYGVAVAGEEGKAGMAALVRGPGFDLAAFAAHCREHLPAYARPLFLRFSDQLDLTGTFKLNKAALAQEGYWASTDPVWRLNPAVGSYSPAATVSPATIRDGIAGSVQT